jgi:hypothetical protein
VTTPSITLQDGKLVLRDGQIGTEQACCCKNCSIKSCAFVAGPLGLPDIAKAGDCEENNDPNLPGCSCEELPQGGCFDDAIIDEEGFPPGDSDDWVFKGKCYSGCAGSAIYFSAKRQVGDASPEAWVDNVRQYLENNGYTSIAQYSEPCDLGGGPDRVLDQLAWVRACCDEELLCPDTAEDCSDMFSFAPDESGGLQPQLVRLGNAPNTTVCPVVDGFLECIPVCGENPLP